MAARARCLTPPGAVGENPFALCCCYPWAGGASALLAFAEINILIQNESRI